MTDRELMQQALDALGAMQSYAAAENKGLRICDEAIEALRARLNGWERVNMTDHKEGDLGIGTVKWDASAPLVVHPHPAFQATPPQQHSEQWWRHEVSNAYAEGYEKGRVMCGCGDQIMPNDGAECGNCVAARNAVKPEQEPQEVIAKWIKANTEHREWYICPKCSHQTPRFKDEWQGLTDDEVNNFAAGCHLGKSVQGAIYEAAAKLREKNHAI